MTVFHQGIIPGHHFAEASAQCLNLYVDGYFLSTVMVTQAVVEGIRKFILERNDIRVHKNMKGPAQVRVLVNKGLISKECARAFTRIYRSFRNDVHHMNPKVAEMSFPELAKRNIEDLAFIEREIFAFEVDDGRIRPLSPQCWEPPDNDGRIQVYLRLEP